MGGIKGKNLFQSARLALTGEMHGQDISKQMSLVAIAAAEDSPLEGGGGGGGGWEVVSVGGRIEKLRGFIETIPEGE